MGVNVVETPAAAVLWMFPSRITDVQMIVFHFVIYFW